MVTRFGTSVSPSAGRPFLRRPFSSTTALAPTSTSRASALKSSPLYEIYKAAGWTFFQVRRLVEVDRNFRAALSSADKSPPAQMRAVTVAMERAVG